jgi:hypothetical protein
MEKEDAFGQKSTTTTANCRLQFLFHHGAVPYTVDCLSFLLIVFKNWSIHIPEQCKHKFSSRGCMGDLSNVRERQMFSLFEIFLSTGTLSFHSYSFHHTAE